MSIYDNLSQEEFHDILEGIVSADGICGWDVPGVREILAEHYNNDVLEEWRDIHGIENPDEID